MYIYFSNRRQISGTERNPSWRPLSLCPLIFGSASWLPGNTAGRPRCFQESAFFVDDTQPNRFGVLRCIDFVSLSENLGHQCIQFFIAFHVNRVDCELIRRILLVLLCPTHWQPPSNSPSASDVHEFRHWSRISIRSCLFCAETRCTTIVTHIDGCILHSKLLVDSEMQGKSGPPRLHPFMFHYAISVS